MDRRLARWARRGGQESGDGRHERLTKGSGGLGKTKAGLGVVKLALFSRGKRRRRAYCAAACAAAERPVGASVGVASPANPSFTVGLFDYVPFYSGPSTSTYTTTTEIVKGE